MEEIEKQKQEALENVKKTATEAANEAVTVKMNEISKKFEAVASKDEAEILKSDFNTSMQELKAQIKELKQVGGNVRENTSFNENLASVIKENAEQIKSFKKGSSEIALTMKTVGDMSIGANFTGATPFIQEVNSNLITSPYNRIWLADLLPQATSTANSIIYPKENGGEGGVAHWTSGDKEQIDSDLTSKSAFFKWLAGYVIVDREMLDDIPWLTSYLQQKMLVSLKTAENDFVLNGTAALDTNRVAGILESATAYDGDFTNFTEMIIDASYGQIPAGTNDFYQPTNVVLHPRDTVAIGLNKAAGSGEYDLPSNSVTFGNGKLAIAGLQTVGTTAMDQNDFLAFDKNAVMFLRRMNPEIRMFEDAALAKKNKVMFRIEERVSMAIFNDLALVKGTYTPAAE